MRRIFAFVLVLMLLPFAWAEQSYLVQGSEWTQELPEEYRPVLEKIEALDAAAVKAQSIYLYPEGEDCWVFCRTKADVFHEGTFWYVNGENAYALGGGSKIWQWEYFPGGKVFYCAMGETKDRKVYAAIASGDAPVMPEVPSGIVSLLGMANGQILCGIMEDRESDYVFLTVDNGELCEVRGVPMDPAGFLSVSGAQAMLSGIREWYGADCTLTSFLYRSTGVITLNFDFSGKTMHAYVWIADGSMQSQTGWEGETVLFDGEGSICREIGLRVIE